MSDSDFPISANELIHLFRGAPPKLCDFCNQPFDERGPIPEEAGEWACYPCWDHWEATGGEARPINPNETQVTHARIQ